MSQVRPISTIKVYQCPQDPGKDCLKSGGVSSSRKSIMMPYTECQFMVDEFYQVEQQERKEVFKGEFWKAAGNGQETGAGTASVCFLYR